MLPNRRGPLLWEWPFSFSSPLLSWAQKCNLMVCPSPYPQPSPREYAVNRIRSALALGICLVFVVSTTRATDPLAPIPAAPAVTAAQKTIRDIYKTDFTKTKTADQLELARKLLKAGEETTNDSIGRYALYQEARTIAAKAGDVALAVSAAEATCKAFEVNRPDLIIATLEAAGKSITHPNKAIVEAALDAAEDQIQVDDYSGASRLLKVAVSAASRVNVNQTALTATVTAMTQDVEAARKAYEATVGERKILTKTPDDPIANLRVGRFLCLIKGDWKAGLPLLAKGEDEKLKAAALKDLAKPTDPMAKVEAGDGWSELGDGFDIRERTQARMRSLMWYQQAAPWLSGLPKARVEKKIDELTKLTAGRVRRADVGAWVVLFRSDDPSIWNTDTKRDVDQFALAVTRAPAATRYLRLTETGKAESVIIEMTRARLTERTENDGYGWIGTKLNRWNSIHLGIYEVAPPTAIRGEIAIYTTTDASGNYKGWGFGHVAGPGGQAASWATKPLDKPVFEIAVKSTALTPEETKRLLKKK